MFHLKSGLPFRLPAPAWPRSRPTGSQIALGSLVVGTALNRFRFDIASLGFRIEHGVFLVVCAWLALRAVDAWRLREPETNLGRAASLWLRDWRRHVQVDEVVLGIYLLLAFLSATMNAPNRIESYKYLGLMVFCLAVYVLVKRLARLPADGRFAILLLMVLGVLEAGLAIGAWVLFPFGIDTGVVRYPFFTNSALDSGACTFQPTATLFEPNILASFLGASALMMIAWSYSTASFARSWRLWMALVVTLVGVAVSLTRAVWPGLVVSFGAVQLFSRDRDRAVSLKSFTALAIGAGAFILVSNVVVPCSINRTVWQQLFEAAVAPKEVIGPRAADSIFIPSLSIGGSNPNSGAGATNQPAPQTTPAPKASVENSATPAQDAGASIKGLSAARVLAVDSLRLRWITYQDAVAKWLDHPWIGNGPNVFAQRNSLDYPKILGTRAWISNAALMTLHDTGVIGFALLGFWFLWIGRDAWRAYRRAPPGLQRTSLFGLLVGTLVLLIAYQLTTALWLGFTWVYLGLIRAETQRLHRDQDGGTRSGLQGLDENANRAG